MGDRSVVEHRSRVTFTIEGDDVQVPIPIKIPGERNPRSRIPPGGIARRRAKCSVAISKHDGDASRAFIGGDEIEKAIPVEVDGAHRINPGLVDRVIRRPGERSVILVQKDGAVPAVADRGDEVKVAVIVQIGGGHSVGIAGETKSPVSAWEIPVTVVHEQRE